jgi:hypothetical protein
MSSGIIRQNIRAFQQTAVAAEPPQPRDDASVALVYQMLAVPRTPDDHVFKSDRVTEFDTAVIVPQDWIDLVTEHDEAVKAARFAQTVPPVGYEVFTLAWNWSVGSE